MLASLAFAAALGGTVPVEPARDAGPETGVLSYAASFFAAGAPTSAKDMIARVPGFTVSDGQSVRGFAGAAGNVLIDGKRPSSKTDSLSDILDRIPAANVLRIDVIREGARGIDMQGQAVIANVILGTSGKSSVTTSAGIKAFGSGRVVPVAQVDWSHRQGEVSAEGSFQAFGDESSNAGHGSLTYRASNGAALAQGSAKISYPTSGLRFRIAAQAPVQGGILRLNLSANYDRYLSNEVANLRDAQTGAGRTDYVVQRDRLPSGELGGDYTRDVGRLEFKAIALQSLSRDIYGSETRLSGLLTNFNQRALSGESIGRVTAAFHRDDKLTLMAGGEGAYNFRDGQSDYLVNGQFTPLPAANVKVEERRGEAFARANWTISPRLSLEMESRFEISRISQQGDANRATTFKSLKPRLLLGYSLAPGWQARVRVEREVGQLNFADYVSSANFTSGNGVSAGNANLVPDRDWVFEGVLERRFWGKGALILTARHYELSDVIDQVPVGGFSAAGNIGNGRRESVALGITLPLAFIGMPGGLLKTEPTWTVSRVTDPTTHQVRKISNEQEVSGTLTLSNDIPRLKSTWQFDLYSPQRIVAYRANQLIRNRQAVWLNISWDYKPKPGLSLLAELHNFTSRSRDRQRVNYTGLRGTGAGYVEDDLAIDWDPYVYLRLRKTW